MLACKDSGERGAPYTRCGSHGGEPRARRSRGESPPTTRVLDPNSGGRCFALKIVSPSFPFLKHSPMYYTWQQSGMHRCCHSPTIFTLSLTPPPSLRESTRTGSCRPRAGRHPLAFCAARSIHRLRFFLSLTVAGRIGAVPFAPSSPPFPIDCCNACPAGSRQ